MLIPLTPLSHVRRRRAPNASASPTPPPVNPVLISAAFQTVEGELKLALGFDRAMDGLNTDFGAFVIVDGAGSGLEYMAAGVVDGTPADVVMLTLDVIGPTETDQSYFSATSPTGIVDADGHPWDGVEQTELPFGA